MRGVLLGSLILVCACGGTDQGLTVDVEHLPAGELCAAGGLRFVVDDQEYTVCNGQDGQDGQDGMNGQDGRDGADGQDGVDGQDGMNGQDGMDGAPGEDGTDGKDGRNGIDGATWYPIGADYCFAFATLPSSATTVLLQYSAILFTDDSLLVNCTVDANGITSADSSFLYLPWQRGASSGLCIVTADSNSDSGGFWTFELDSNGAPSVTYLDNDSPDSGHVHRFLASECAHQDRPQLF